MNLTLDADFGGMFFTNVPFAEITQISSSRPSEAVADAVKTLFLFSPNYHNLQNFQFLKCYVFSHIEFLTPIGQFFNTGQILTPMI